MFSVYLGDHSMPDGSDADEGWIYEDLPDTEFERRWPKAKKGSDGEFKALVGAQNADRWRGEKTTRIVDYYYKVFKKDVLYALADDKTMLKSVYDKLVDDPNYELPPVVSEREVETCEVKKQNTTCLLFMCSVLNPR